MEGEQGEENDGDSDENLESNAMIKASKKPAKGGTSGRGKGGKGKEETAKGKGKGRGKNRK